MQACISDVKIEGWNVDLKNPLYKLSLTSDNESWSVLRKYSEFQQLRTILKTCFPGSHLKKIPGLKKLVFYHYIASVKRFSEGMTQFVGDIINNATLFEKFIHFFRSII
ncbi:unnamed protein product [Gordionus sp. m RMFG-2023]